MSAGAPRLRGCILAVLATSASAVAIGQDAAPINELAWSDLAPAPTPECREVLAKWNDPEACNGFRVDIEYLRCGAATVALAEAIEGTLVQIVGYAHPLEFEFQGVKRFMLAPPLAACSHPPAPPGNQLIAIEYEPGIDLNRDPVRVIGHIRRGATRFGPYISRYGLRAVSVRPALISELRQ